MMKKVLCLTDGFTLGGAERQLIGLAYFLKKRGYDVDLACYYEKNFYTELISSYGLNCITLHATLYFSKIISIWKLVKFGHYDCVIAYKNGATMILSILKLLGIRCNAIVSERNTTQNITIRERVKFILYRFADFIVPNSYSQEKFIKENFLNLATKVVTITNFTDTNHFVPNNENVSRNRIRLVVAGRIAEQKNILRFILVIKKLKEKKMQVVVDWYGNVSAGEQKYEEETRRLVSEYAVEDYIHFFPATTNILHEYQICDAFCLPSLYEGFPNVICEAMSCGLPILCSRVCDNPYIVDEGKSGYMFDPLNEDDILNAIVKFCKLSSLERTKMGKYNRKIAQQKFSEEVFVQKYIKLLESR